MMPVEVNLYKYIKGLSKSSSIVFVKDAKGLSQRMKKCLEETKQISDAMIRRMTEEEVIDIKKSELHLQSYVFIFEYFTGSAFEYLTSNIKGEQNIFGLPLIERMHALENEATITNYYKVFNAAFKNITVCFSNISSAEKVKLEKLLKYMNGTFSNELNDSVTHLVTNSTKTAKYAEAASKRNLPIYHVDWIENVWRRSNKVNEWDLVKADADNFDSYKLPALFDLKISATGIDKDSRDKLVDLVEENGGIFEEVFKPTSTDILIMGTEDTKNVKYKFAQKHHIPCLKISWIEDSISGGFALPYNKYSAITEKATKSQRRSEENIKSTDSEGTSCNDEISTENKSPIVPTTAKNREVLTDITNEEDLSSSITIERAKKIGCLFDGYVFYLNGSSFETFHKLGKVLNICGSTKIDEINEQVTHILCSSDVNNFEQLQNEIQSKNVHPSVLKFSWFTECFKQGQIVSESDYIIESAVGKTLVPPSPLSKKAMQSLNSSIIRSLSNQNLTARKNRSDTRKDVMQNVIASKKRKSDEEISSIDIDDNKRRRHERGVFKGLQKLKFTTKD